MFGLLLILLGLGVVTGFIDTWISRQTQARLYSDLAQVPAKSVGLLLGTRPTLPDGRVNLYFQYRIDAALALYRAGKVRHLLLSGAVRPDYDEPSAMWAALRAGGIPEAALSVDPAGFRTLDSLVRASTVYGLDDFLIISQAFHNQRALFIADYRGITALAYNAAGVTGIAQLRQQGREYLARLRAVWDWALFRMGVSF